MLNLLMRARYLFDFLPNFLALLRPFPSWVVKDRGRTLFKSLSSSFPRPRCPRQAPGPDPRVLSDWSSNFGWLYYMIFSSTYFVSCVGLGREMEKAKQNHAGDKPTLTKKKPQRGRGDHVTEEYDRLLWEWRTATNGG